MSSLCLLIPHLALVFQFAQVAWRPLVATMVTAKMACVVLGDVGATQDSEEQPANCVPPAIMAPTAQVDHKEETHSRVGF